MRIMDRLDCKWEAEQEKKTGAKLIRYADDVIVLSRHSEVWLYKELKGILEGELKLKINEDKSGIVDIDKSAVRFLGFEIRRVRSKKSRKLFAMCYPGKKARKAVYEKIRKVITRKRHRAGYGWKSIKPVLIPPKRSLEAI